MQKGFTLIEVIIGIFILSTLAVTSAQIYSLIIRQIVIYREQSTISSLADQYLEVARNLPYSQIGTMTGNPHGNLADLPNPLTVTVNGTAYQVYYAVSYVDDAADGTILAGTDAAPDDYKQVKLYIKNATTNVLNSFFTSIVPKGLEGLASGGALYIKVFDAVGQPVSGATIQIQNMSVTPNINLQRTSDASGNWIEVGLPVSSNSYHIVVTKNGYSSDQTYPITQQNQNPTKPDSTVSNGQVTQVSFSIDLTSNLSFKITSDICQGLAGVGLGIRGAKLIGTSPDVYKFNNTYSSDGSGNISLNNIEWDSYIPSLTGSTYMIYGSSPVQQANLLPGTTQSFTMVVGPKTTNSLLVVVKDASTSNPIEGADVDLQTSNPTTDNDKFTSGSIWSQQDWSLGSGQNNFTNDRKYYQDDGNIDNSGNPSGIKLLSFAGAYANAGTLESSSFDTGTSASAYTILEWQPTSQDPSTSLKFQVATNNDNTTWNYLGPDGTANSYYTVPGTNMSGALDDHRYVRYKAFLSTQNTTKTPVLTSLNLNYVSGCFTPGQAMFPGLAAGSNYQVVVTAAGYQTQTISNITISGYNTLQVLLNH